MKALVKMFVFLILIGCSSDEPSKIYDENPIQQDPQDDPNSENQEPILYENVVSILDSKSQIISSESDLLNGIYIIEFSETPPEIQMNDIIVGGEGYGFIRKVNSVSVDGSVTTMSTAPANLSDVFKSGTIEFTTDLTNSVNRSNKRSAKIPLGLEAREEFSFDLSDLDLGPYFTLTTGKVSFNPSLGPIVVQYDGSQSREMSFNDNEILLSTELEFVIESGGPVDYPVMINQDPIELEYPQEILGLEFNLVITIEPVIDFSLFIDDSFKATGGVINNAMANLDAGNNNSTWNTNDSFNVNTTSSSVYLEKPANVQQHFTFIVRLSAQVNLLPAIYMQGDLKEDFYVNYAEETGDWDSGLSSGLDFNYGIYGEIFGFEYDLSEPPYNYNEMLWSAPTNLRIESGDGQTGVYYGENENSPLEEPLKVLVLDSDDNPLGNVFVHYRVVTGGGSLDVLNVPTGVAGVAENNWTLGNESEDQMVEVTITKANGDLIGDSPLEFHATMIDLSGEWVIVGTSSNCPEGVNYRFSFNPNNNSINILNEDTEEITGTSFIFDLDDLFLSIGIYSLEHFEYFCEEDEIFYATDETGAAGITGYYNNQEFTGEFTVSFTELPVNPCVNNFSCNGTFRMFKD